MALKKGLEKSEEKRQAAGGVERADRTHVYA